MARRPLKRHVQQDLRLDSPRHGGKRAGAGRPRKPGRRRVAHTTRAAVKPRFPLHVTLRVCRDVPRLRNFALVPTLRRAFVGGNAKPGFRICQFSIQGNHIHLIVEGSDAHAVARGMQGFAVRLARTLNTRIGRDGRVFDDRYHARALETPSETRAALLYVLNNARRHYEYLPARFGGIDPFSSAYHFDGWRDHAWRDGLEPPPDKPVARACSWLLTTGWRKRGLIATTETPAPATPR
jgi:REP element-mobilizing transposase RayT